MFEKMLRNCEADHFMSVVETRSKCNSYCSEVSWT